LKIVDFEKINQISCSFCNWYCFSILDEK